MTDKEMSDGIKYKYWLGQTPTTKEILDTLDKYKQALDEIAEIVSEPCIILKKTCKECNSNCEHKDILNIINEVKEKN